MLATQMLIRSTRILVIKAEIVMLRKQRTTGLKNYERKATLESQKLVKTMDRRKEYQPKNMPSIFIT